MASLGPFRVAGGAWTDVVASFTGVAAGTKYAVICFGNVWKTEQAVAPAKEPFLALPQSAALTVPSDRIAGIPLVKAPGVNFIQTPEAGEQLYLATDQSDVSVMFEEVAE